MTTKYFCSQLTMGAVPSSVNEKNEEDVEIQLACALYMLKRKENEIKSLRMSIHDILFDNREKIPEGLYLQLMDTTKMKISDMNCKKIFLYSRYAHQLRPSLTSFYPLLTFCNIPLCDPFLAEIQSHVLLFLHDFLLLGLPDMSMLHFLGFLDFLEDFLPFLLIFLVDFLQ